MRSVFKRCVLAGTALAVFSAVSPAVAQVPFPLTITRNGARAAVELPGGIAAEVTIQFEEVVGLHPAALEVVATLIDPLDPALLSRLPGQVVLSPPPLLGAPLEPAATPSVTIPASFPLLLRIGPTASSMLSFAGLATVSIHTENLELDRTVPMALYKAHDGGPFQDITATEGRGSYRAGGGGGDFSEFLIVVDQRPIDLVITAKFEALEALLSEHEALIAPLVLQNLRQSLGTAEDLYLAGATRQAVAEMRSFSRYVAAQSGMDVPDVWRAGCPGVPNVDGLLRGAADTLRFSLDRKASQ